MSCRCASGYGANLLGKCVPAGGPLQASEVVSTVRSEVYSAWTGRSAVCASDWRGWLLYKLKPRGSMRISSNLGFEWNCLLKDMEFILL